MLGVIKEEMRAIVCEQYGSPDVLQLKRVPVPSPQKGEVLVRVHAVSLNDWDLWFTGKPRMYRLMSGLTRPKFQIMGSDIAGTVEAVGEGVVRYQVGDHVYGDLSESWGGFAEYVCAKVGALTTKPAGMSWTDAAAIPQAATLALQGLVDAGQIKSGMKILINGAGGGVGTFGVQLAKQHDTEVTGVDNAGKLELMTSLGFDHVIDYEAEDFTKNGLQYDLILDQKTTRAPWRYLRSLRPGGSYITTGGDPGKLMCLGILGPLIKVLTGKTTRLVILQLNKDMDLLSSLYEGGTLRPVKDRLFALEEVPNAFRLFMEKKHHGKLVVSVCER